MLATPVAPSAADEPAKLLMRFVRPVWQDAADEAHPAPTRGFTGVLSLVVDVAELTGSVTRDIRSGKTGYAWVIDGNGIFLHHQEAIFIGKNAFEARTAKMPTISFARINEIQKTLMLAGKEGTSWYISGWHLGVEGKVRKLIAYAPIRVTDEEGGPLWSVAVVAPISEVEGAIHAIQVRGLLLQAVIIAVFVLGTVIIISLMARWSADLEREVRTRRRNSRSPSSATARSWRTPGTSSSRPTGPGPSSRSTPTAPRSSGCPPRRSSAATSRRFSPAPPPRSRCWPSTRSSRARRAARSPTW